MDPDEIDYAAMLQEALRDVVRRAMEQVAEHGLPGDHYFYIGFRTDAPGVEVPRFLREQHPQEMTIILQHQFWGLEVTPEGFSALLSFGGSKQRISVPFAALTAFADPSADFGLRFGDGTEEGLEPEESPAPGPERSGEVIRFDPSRRR
jgi:uncharacterized protein